MSLRTAFQVIAVVVVGAILLVSFLSMGPIGWVVIGLLLVTGVVQVHRTRREHRTGDDEQVRFCPNCGTELPALPENGVSADDQEYQVNYCSSCGAPVPTEADTDAPTQHNCSNCGTLNDASQDDCDYCGTEL